MPNKYGFKTYCYLIGWSCLDVWYYGRRTRNNRPPTEDFWKKYRGSSKHVDAFIEQYGEPDVIEIRREFDTELEARDWEFKVLKRLGAVRSNRWLNKNNGGKEFYRLSYVMPEEQKRKISESLTGRKREEFSDEWKANLSKGKVGKKMVVTEKMLYARRNPSEEARKNISIAAKKRWETRDRKGHPNSLNAMHQACRGRKRSPEEIEKCRNTRERNKLDPGYKPVSYTWINDGLKNSRIEKDSTILEGWTKGKLTFVTPKPRKKKNTV